MGINPDNKITIIIIILFAVTLFQHFLSFMLHPQQGIPGSPKPMAGSNVPFS
jgi:hypothetical protein